MRRNIPGPPEFLLAPAGNGFRPTRPGRWLEPDASSEVCRMKRARYRAQAEADEQRAVHTCHGARGPAVRLAVKTPMYGKAFGNALPVRGEIQRRAHQDRKRSRLEKCMGNPSRRPRNESPFPASARRGGVRHRVFSRAQESVQHAASLPGDAGERDERLPSGNSDKGDGETHPRVNPHLDAESPDDTPRVAGVAECGINRDGEEDVATGDFGQEMEENGYQDERRREGCDQRPQNRIACDYRCWRCGHVREHAQSPLAEAQALTWRA